jgi:polar amino acid transport system substrate-binding protein
MKWRIVSAVLGIIALVIAVNVITNLFSKPTVNVSEARKRDTSVYDRVLKAGKIRCGYVTYPPSCIKDPNTGELSGIFIETIKEVGENLELVIEFTEEVGWGSMIEGLKTNRYDLICSPVWASTSRGKQADFSMPLFYSGIGVYVREDDNRFENLSEIDSDSVKIATIDGEITDIIARSEFPNASRVSLPQLSDLSQILLNVARGRADVTFVEPHIGFQFLKNNPGTVKNIAEAKPIRIFPNSMMFKKGQVEFKSMLDTALEELINIGHVDKIIDKYEPYPGIFYRTSFKYRTP